MRHSLVTQSIPYAFSRRAVVSYWRKYVNEVLVNRFGGLSLPRKSVVRLTDRPDMTLDVYRGRKTTMQQQQQQQSIPGVATSHTLRRNFVTCLTQTSPSKVLLLFDFGYVDSNCIYLIAESKGAAF